MNLTELVETIKESLNKSPKPYDTTAEVVRVEGETAWVQIPGSEDETPVNLTIAAKEGDNVQVRVSGGTAFLVGNATAPPTDDATAIRASIQSEEADAKATEALELAETAYTKTTTAEQEFAAAVININTDIADLQNQIDGNITTWFYAYVPTTSNAPANTWTTTEDKNNHLGDLFYDTSTGYAYRWMLEDNTYSWSRITDTDVAEALAAAAQAQDTADSKRRVFIVEPTAPYDVGDIWFQGATGDILVCTNARASIIVGSAVVGMTVLGNSAYSSSDWEKRNKYTDDTVASQAKTIADNTAQYFWVNSTGTDTGAHITEVTQDDWNNSSSPNYHSGGNLLARSNGIAVRDGLTELASFGANGSRIGISTQAHVDIDYHSLALKRKEGGSYFVVQDLRNQSGQYSATDVFTGNGSKKIYSLTYPAANTSYTVTVSDSSGGTVTKGENDVEFSTAPTNGATITVSYTTTTPTTIALTFGDRAYGSTLGGYSSVLGYDAVASGFASHALNSGTVAASDDQTAIGTYNEVDSGHKYAFIIGNGSDDDERSNALTVDWHGNAAGKSFAFTSVPTFTTPSIYSSRCQSLTGGYFKAGKLVYVQLGGTNNYTRSATSRSGIQYMTGFPKPSPTARAALSVLWDNHQGMVANIQADGYLYMCNDDGLALSGDETFFITGTYFTSD